MDKKSYPFSNLTESELDAIISRAQRERAEAIATAFIWLGGLLRRLLVTPTVRLWSAAHPSAPAHKAVHH
jgi:hypothetical protein